MSQSQTVNPAINVQVQHLAMTDFAAFGATAEELVAYALDDIGVLSPDTLINGERARPLVESFYHKRQQVRRSTRLGNLLIQSGVITREQLIEALSCHVTREVPLGEALILLSFCTQEQLDDTLSQQAEMRRRLNS
jgi:hypothetical protein